MLTKHQWGLVAFIWGKLTGNTKIAVLEWNLKMVNSRLQQHLTRATEVTYEALVVPTIDKLITATMIHSNHHFYDKCPNGPLTRYVKLRAARAPGMPGTFSPHRLQRKPLVSDPGMQGTCVTHVPWCIWGSLISSGGENVPSIPGACAILNFCVSGKRPINRTNILD